MARKHLCIISLSLPIEVDIRLIKQIEYLAPHYHLTVIGYGNPERVWDHISSWKPIDRTESPRQKLWERALVFGGRVLPKFYDVWYWQRPRYQQALNCARMARADAFLADDWAAIPLAVTAAGQRPVVFDADEYWPGEVESSQAWKLFFSPLIRHFLTKYAGKVQASATVSQPMADRYHAEFGLNPILVYNAPKFVDVPRRDIDPEHITLVHQGSPVPNRRLETLIEAVALADARYTLHLMLVAPESDPYYRSLVHLAETVAPGRVFFQPPVYPTEIVRAIAQYDIGISLIPPATATYWLTLPNKIFESIVAGQPVIVGRSPAMADLIRQHDVGWVTADFTAAALAQTLNALTTDDIRAARERARRAAQILNAEVEMAKLVNLLSELLANADVA